MPQSLSQVIIHIVFSTKDRHPWLDPAIRPRTHAYLATVCRDCGCEAYRVGGAADHVHIAARLARTISQSELLEKIKKTSSAWIKTQGPEFGSSRTKRRITEPKPFRRNTAICCRNITFRLMNGTCGIEMTRVQTQVMR